MKRTVYDAFTEVFEKHLGKEPTHTSAFNKAEEEFESKHGFSPYSSHNSYRNIRANKIKRKRNKIALHRR